MWAEKKLSRLLWHDVDHLKLVVADGKKENRSADVTVPSAATSQPPLAYSHHRYMGWPGFLLFWARPIAAGLWLNEGPFSGNIGLKAATSVRECLALKLNLLAVSSLSYL